MDLVRLSAPWMLLAAVPAWAVILWSALGGRGRQPRGWLRATLGCVMVGLLSAALAGPSVLTSERGRAPLVIVHDVSPSMLAGRTAEDHARRLAAVTSHMPAGRVGLVTVAATVLQTVPPGSPQADGLDRAEGFLAAASKHSGESLAGTDLAAGLAAAGQVLSGDGAILLYSDGRQTRGDARLAASQLAAAGRQVHVLLPPGPPPDLRIAWLGPADQPRSGRPLRIAVRVGATAATEAAVRVARRPTALLGGAAWDLRTPVGPDGLVTLAIDDGPLSDDLYVYEAEVLDQRDPCPLNNRARCSVRVGRIDELAYVYDGQEPGPALEVLTRFAPAGMRIVPRPASAATAPTASVVVLDNVSAWALGDRQARHLVRQVTDAGVGLLALGGDSAFAAGGYADSPLESILPVTSRTAERPAMEIVLVLDASGSMNEQVGQVRKLALAKQAVLGLRPAFAANDRVGLVLFAAEPRVLSPLVPLTQWEQLRADLLAVSAGGGTRITPALTAAIALMPQPPTQTGTIRHLLLLSDGRSEDFDVSGLADLARARSVTISVVATGSDADGDRLGRLAADTGGRLYASADIGRLAETFLKDLAWARGEGLRERRAAAEWRRPEPVWPAPGPPLPDVPAWNPTRAKQGAIVHWAASAPAEEPTPEPPLLATWQRGLGKVAAMPWQVGSAAAKDWPADILGRSLAAVLDHIAPPAAPTEWSAQLVDRNGTWYVRAVESADALGKTASPFVATVLDRQAPDSPPILLSQVAPGVHEARLAERSGEPAVVSVRRQGETAAANLTMPALCAAEFDRVDIDRLRLEEIAAAGGGAVHEAAESVLAAMDQLRRYGYSPAGLYLAGAAGAVALVQAALRLAGVL